MSISCSAGEDHVVATTSSGEVLQFDMAAVQVSVCVGSSRPDKRLCCVLFFVGNNQGNNRLDAHFFRSQ